MKKLLIIGLFALALPFSVFAQKASIKQLNVFQDSLKSLGNQLINSEVDVHRKVANVTFIKTLVSALKIPNSFLYPFDSVKTISIVNSPDNKFRIFSWYILFNDGSYRFYGAVQMNTGGALKLYGLEDYSPLLKNPQDSVTNNTKWYGAQYYKIIPVYAATPYYVLLGWKGNTIESTKKVIDVVSFKNGGIQFGEPVFDEKGQVRKRVIFEYARQASMMMRYSSDQNLIVFDHLAPPDSKSKGKPQTYGPDLSYDGYKLKNGRWEYVENLDLRNIPNDKDVKYHDPKLAKKWDKDDKQ